MEVSQYDSVMLRMPINSILECGDVLLLLTVIPVWGSSLLVTQFQIRQEMTFHLRIVALLDYEKRTAPVLLETFRATNGASQRVPLYLAGTHS